jgi:hypothetical protein
VRYLAQFDDPLADALALELGDAELGDDKVDIGPQGNATPAPDAEVGNNPGNLAAIGGGRQGDDRQPALGKGGAANEIGLIAGTAEKTAGRANRSRPGR